MSMDGRIELKKPIVSQTNLTLCSADYFQTCWCFPNSSRIQRCNYLLKFLDSFSNSSVLCVYHTVRHSIDCFQTDAINSENSSVSTFYVYATWILFLVGLVGNGISILILISSTLHRSNIYRNFIILCCFNIVYLFFVLIRHSNSYDQDLRTVSTRWCHVHAFLVAFSGHLCSWQLVSTSIQRVYALFTLQSRRTTSWFYTCSIVFVGIVLPLFVLDGQILMENGIFSCAGFCNLTQRFDGKNIQRALNFPLNDSSPLKTLPVRYFSHSSISSRLCVLWNILDTIIYAIMPFLITFVCNIFIIIQVCRRRRSTIRFGGIHHRIGDRSSTVDQLSILLIFVNILFLSMTSPLNISLILQSSFEYFQMSSSNKRKLFATLNEYFRLLQNSYHALSFLFYCLSGNKFRKSARVFAQRTLWMFRTFNQNHRQSIFSLVCVHRRWSSSSGRTGSTTSKRSCSQVNRRVTFELLPRVIEEGNQIKSTSHVTLPTMNELFVQRSTFV